MATRTGGHASGRPSSDGVAPGYRSAGARADDRSPPTEQRPRARVRGRGGRYRGRDVVDGDLEAMSILGDALAPQGTMIMTVPVGQDLVCAPYHRIYGETRLPKLLAGCEIEEEQYWNKDTRARRWRRV